LLIYDWINRWRWQVYGLFTHLTPKDESVYAYIKEYEGEMVLVVLNFTASEVEYKLPEDTAGKRVKAFIANTGRTQPDTVDRELKLTPFEAVALVL
jgi:oligo-1,6-glucosidase